MSGFKVAVIINGVSNYGGKEIAKGLTKFFKGHIYLTGSDKKKISDVQFEIKREHLAKNIRCHYLDPSNNDSVKDFQTWLRDYYGTVDVYINYEGITDYDDKIDKMNYYELTKYCLEKNYYQVKKTDSWMFPLLAPDAHVIHLISNFGEIDQNLSIIDKQLINSINSHDLTEHDLDTLLQIYLRNLTKENVVKTVDLNAKKNIETISRIALRELTKIQQQTFNEQNLNISVNILITSHIVGTYLDKNYCHILTGQQAAQTPIKMALRKNNLSFPRKGKLIFGLRNISFLI